MSRKTCFMIFIAVSVILLVAHILNLKVVMAPAGNIFSAMGSPYIAGSAVVLALLLNKQKYYWLIMLGCAVLAAVLIQLLVVGSSLMALSLIYKATAFLIYAYWVSLIKFMI